MLSVSYAEHHKKLIMLGVVILNVVVLCRGASQGKHSHCRCRGWFDGKLRQCK